MIILIYILAILPIHFLKLLVYWNKRDVFPVSENIEKKWRAPLFGGFKWIRLNYMAFLFVWGGVTGIAFQLLKPTTPEQIVFGLSLFPLYFLVEITVLYAFFPVQYVITKDNKLLIKHPAIPNFRQVDSKNYYMRYIPTIIHTIFIKPSPLLRGNVKMYPITSVVVKPYGLHIFYRETDGRPRYTIVFCEPSLREEILVRFNLTKYVKGT